MIKDEEQRFDGHMKFLYLGNILIVMSTFDLWSYLIPILSPVFTLWCM